MNTIYESVSLQKVFNTANASLHERVAGSGSRLPILCEQAHLYTSHNCSFKNGIGNM